MQNVTIRKKKCLETRETLLVYGEIKPQLFCLRVDLPFNLAVHEYCHWIDQCT